MKRTALLLAAIALPLLYTSTSMAQAPGGPQGGPQGGQQGGQQGGPGGGRGPRGGGDGHRPPPPPIISALDANHDGEIDASEIANASNALKGLDKNGDGKLTPDEVHPFPPKGGRGGQGGPGGGPKGQCDDQGGDAGAKQPL